MFETYIRSAIRKLVPIPIKVNCGERFIYWNDGIHEVINYTIDEKHPELAKEFSDYIEQKYNIDMKKYYFTFCLLHEIGHYYTKTEVDIETENVLRQLIKMDENSSNAAYFELPSEQLANEFAYQFFKLYPRDVNYFQRKVVPVIYYYGKHYQSNHYIQVKGNLCYEVNN